MAYSELNPNFDPYLIIIKCKWTNLSSNHPLDLITSPHQKSACVKFSRKTSTKPGLTRLNNNSTIFMRCKVCIPRFCSRVRSDSTSPSFCLSTREGKSHRQSTKSSNFLNIPNYILDAMSFIERKSARSLAGPPRPASTKSTTNTLSSRNISLSRKFAHMSSKRHKRTIK